MKPLVPALRAPTTPTEKHSRAQSGLTHQLKQCTCWQEVRDLVRNNHVYLNRTHIGAAVTRTANLVSHHREACNGPQQQRRWPRWQESAAEAVPEQLDFSSNDGLRLFVSELEDLSLQHMAAFSSRQVANVMWGLAKLGHQPSSAWLTAALAAAERYLDIAIGPVAAESPGNADSSSISSAAGDLPAGYGGKADGGSVDADDVNLAAAAAASGAGAGSVAAGSLPVHTADAVAASTAAIDPISISQIIWAMATWKRCPSESWMHKYLVVSEVQMASCGAQSLSNIIWALATLRQLPPPGWLAAFWRNSMPDRLQPSGRHAPASAKRSEAPPEAAPTAAASSTTPATAGSTPPPSHITQAQDPAITHGGESSGAAAGGALGPERAVVVEDQAPSPNRAAGPVGRPALSRGADHGLTPQGVANTLWAVATLQLVPPDGKWLDAYQRRSFAMTQRMAPADLANVLWAVANIRLVTGECKQKYKIQLESQMHRIQVQMSADR